jgi:hypothetical protein
MHVYGVAHHAIAVPARKEQAGLSALAVRVSNQVKVVRTWGDLTQQPTIDAGDGVSVRLGIGASHGPLNSGVLLYCLADGYNYFEHPNITLAGLGPLSVSMRRGEESLVVTDIGTPVMLSYKGWNTVQGCTLFFAKSVLIDAPGRYEITIRARSGPELARAAIASSKCQSSLLTLSARVDKGLPCRASCALSILGPCITS